MGDHMIGQGDATPQANEMSAIGKKFFDDANNDTTDAKLGRVLTVTGKGLKETPEGAWNSLKEMAKPENYGKDLALVASSAAFGAALRVALPESGALKSIVGVGMGVMFVKDAAKPLGDAWGKVWNDKSDQTMKSASKDLGAGLGDFAVQGTLSMAIAGGAAKLTPGLMEGVAPKTWGKIETWKANNLGGASTVDVGMRSQESLVGKGGQPRPEISGHSAPGRVSDGMKLALGETKVGDGTVSKGPSVKDMSREEISAAIESSRINEHARVANSNFSRFGIKGSDGNFHSHDDVVDLLMQGKDPSVEPAGAINVAKSVPLTRMDLTRPENLVIAEKPAGLVSEELTEAAVRKGGGHKAPVPSDKAPIPAAGSDTIVRPTDAAGDGTHVTDASKILNPKTMAGQAAAIKESLGQISDQDGLIMDAMNRNLGAIDVRTDPNVKPLQGYDRARQSAFELAAQVGTDPGSFQQVSDLYERFAAGALQSGTAGTSDIAAHVARMDQYARENFTTYRDNIIKAGIDPDVALAQKPSPPLVEGTSDVERIGTDQNGDPVFAHQGPHTVRAIYGPNGEPVWPIDLVKTPIREIGMRGVNTSGIYGHEFMHDQFGHLAEFDPEVRDKTLIDAATKAWGDKANDPVKLPNGGIDPQQVKLDGVVRKMAKVPEADRDAFLTEELGLDMRSKVIRGARAADSILGDTGKATVQVPGAGPMPLELFVGNIAAMADDRAPSAILAELQGKGTPEATATAVAAKVDQILGPNGRQQLPLADGSKITLKDAVMKVSDETRNPKFDTYAKPLPATMTNAEILVNVAKAWADETFADWGAAAESGQTAAPYFQALSKDGLLRTSTVMGQDMRSDANPLGIEAHPTDVLRPGNYQAELIRALATAKGQKDQVLLDWADALQAYAKGSAKNVPVTFPSLDTPGQSISIPREVFDKFVPELVQAQLNTPLPRLQGRTLFDILPDLRKNFRINQGISDSWISAIKAGEGPESVSGFDASKTKMTNVYGAGQLAFLKLVSEGMDPVKANDAVNAFSDHFGDAIVKDRASVPVATSGAPKLNFAAMARPLPEGAFDKPSLRTGIVSDSPLTHTEATAPGAAPARGDMLGRAANWTWKVGTSPEAASAYGAYQINDLLGMYRKQQDLLGDKQH